MASELFLIRHGETRWSLTGQHTGLTDLPLTENGEREVAPFRPLLGGHDFRRVFTSPRQRARRTAELAGLAARAEIEPDLREWDYGDYEGRTTEEIRALRPGWLIFRDGCPGGETVAQIAGRADRVLARVGGSEGAVALFSHGHFLRVLAARWLGLPVQEGRHLVLDTASLSILGHERPEAATPVISLWNARAAGIARP